MDRIWPETEACSCSSLKVKAMGHGESRGAVTTISSDCFPRCTSPVAGVAVAAGGSLENFQANVPLESELLVIVSLRTVGSPVELEHLPSRLRSKYELEEWHLMNRYADHQRLSVASDPGSRLLQDGSAGLTRLP
jgi:hypothetical protein